MAYDPVKAHAYYMKRRKLKGYHRVGTRAESSKDSSSGAGGKLLASTRDTIQSTVDVLQAAVSAQTLTPEQKEQLRTAIKSMKKRLQKL